MKFCCFVKDLLDRGMKIIKMTFVIVNSVIINKGFLTRQFGIIQFSNSYNIIGDIYSVSNTNIISSMCKSYNLPFSVM